MMESRSSITTNIPPEQSLELLQHAKTLLISHGWTQGQFMKTTKDWRGNTIKRYCIIGALCVAFEQMNASRIPSNLDVFILTSSSLPVKTFTDKFETTIDNWNDDPSRTFQDVMDAFDNAILEIKESIATNNSIDEEIQ